MEKVKTASVQIADRKKLEDFSKHPVNKEINDIFKSVFGDEKPKISWQSASSLSQGPSSEEIDLGDSMTDKDQELSLDDLGELEIDNTGNQETSTLEEEGFELSLDSSAELDLADPDELPPDLGELDGGMDLSLDDSLGDEDLTKTSNKKRTELEDDIPSLDFGAADSADADLSKDAMDKLKEIDALMDLDASQSNIRLGSDSDELSLGGDDLSLGGDDLSLGGDDLSLGGDDLSLGGDDLNFSGEELSFGDEASIETDVSVDLNSNDSLSLEADTDSDLDKPLVSDDLDLDSINFSSDEVEIKEDKSKKKPKDFIKEVKASSEVKEPQQRPAPGTEINDVREANPYQGNVGKDLNDIKVAYSAEMERMQATLSNLRTDREELLGKIDKLEEDKLTQNRYVLNMRAELDEKKIELSIIRKKLNDEITELKDRLKVYDEKKLIIEEKNKILMMEMEKVAQKNKVDLKRVQMRERELEQKLELLKADSETQIRHRDLKILELKRKIDSMEFDMESITVQEKRSVESRFELEDKLDKAIKTLRSAINVLEEESDKSNVLEALKKNIDM